MRRQAAGFTLIELVIVIIILGILAAVAIPQFWDLSDEAKNSSIAGVAGALSSANAINYAAKKANSTKGSDITNCTDVGSALAGGLPPGYVITAAPIDPDETVSCTLTYTPASGSPITANFTATGIGGTL